MATKNIDKAKVKKLSEDIKVILEDELYRPKPPMLVRRPSLECVYLQVRQDAINLGCEDIPLPQGKPIIDLQELQQYLAKKASEKTETEQIGEQKKGAETKETSGKAGETKNQQSAETGGNVTLAKIWACIKRIPRWIYVLVIFLAALLGIFEKFGCLEPIKTFIRNILWHR